MNFEVIQGKYEQKNLQAVANGQIKVPTRVTLQTPAKKILSTTAQCFIGGVEKNESAFIVTGKVTTRVIYIDESGAYNSEDKHDEWTEKLAHKNADSILAVSPSVHLLETKDGERVKNEEGNITEVASSHVINVSLLGLSGRTAQYVSELKGDVESKREKATMTTWGQCFSEKFDISETFALDAGIEGILGVEVTAILRDVSCADGRVTLKGAACANVAAVKTVDGASCIYNSFYDWDFTKTLNNKEISDNDIVCGTLCMAGNSVKVENRDKPELVIEAELLFNGCSTTSHEVEVVEDAFAYENHLNFTFDDSLNVQLTPQTNIAVDVEGNVTMPEGSPFIGKVLSVNGLHISGINAIAGYGKVTVEGVITAHLTYECEEKNIYSYTAQVPFSANCKIEDCTETHNIAVSVTPMSCNVKARRGKELLIDARVGLSVFANNFDEHKIASNVILGQTKPRDNSAIIIHVAGANEDLWSIAKRTSIPSEEILKQNPNLENGINDGERIVLYRQEVVSY